MSTIVSFHAHPDDETILCGGTLAKAAADGHRTVLVTATRGDHGEVPDGFLDQDEPLAQRRTLELAHAARILGVARSEFLGYVDSGMRNTPTNGGPDAFWQADLEEAAGRLARILIEEHAEVLTVYDDHGGYGHPDHIQVHRVGIRAAELAGTPYVFEATLNRDQVTRLRAALAAEQPAAGQPAQREVDGVDESIGLPEADLTTAVDVTDFLERKREAMVAHASQISDESFFLAMPAEAFKVAFGTEWFRQRRTDRTWSPPRSTSLFVDDPV